ncbi:MAG: hypothetical protein NC311_06485 [Muribaculaceae bacterium]|nr:hypothetical protein [Muribaculaceae bacterium]
MYQRVDINPDDLALLDPKVEPDDTGFVPTEQDRPVLQNEGYSPDTADFSSPISNTNRDATHLQKKDPTDASLLDGGDTTDTGIINGDDDEEERKQAERVPSAVVDYYNEAALKSKARNALPDEAFGLPRLRAYPLHDRAHVKQAIRMFGHCKDPKDKEILAGNIFKAMEKHGITTKIGKKNALYAYAPKALQEATSLPSFSIDGSEIPIEKRTKEDVVKEHLRVNGTFYNNVFYGAEFAKAAKAVSEFQFFDYFYPDLKRMPFALRLECACGGLAASSCRDEIYAALGIRSPLCTDFTKPLGWCSSSSVAENEERYRMFTTNEYVASSNWFKVDLGNDVDHQFFCLRLYSIMGEILLDPNFDPEVHLSENHQALLMDWNQRVGYHYDLYLDAEPGSYEQLCEIQYLFDLFWTFTENPFSEGDISVNIIAMLREMACVRDMVVNMNEANDSGELITREKCNAYLVHDLDMVDSLYLLPNTLEYPVVNQQSIRLAMDLIEQIDAECRDEFVANLNRKYKEFGCTFSISVDHPYAKYADKNIIAHMTHMLLEGKTAVDDQGTSSDIPNPAETSWYKRLDYVRGPTVNLLDNKELGPNKKKQQEPDYTQHDSVL